MNSNIKIFLLCPVPEEQKPMNDYIQLKENELTRWVAFPTPQYRQTLARLAGGCFFLFSLLNFWNLQGTEYFFEWILHTIIQSSLLLLFLLLINFIRWKQMETNLYKARLFYEEASWYDGQVWEKPFSILKNDKLLSTQKIEPILQRILGTSGTLSFLTFLLGLLFHLV
jgi:hypothetical protein